MRTHNITAALVISLSCALTAAACMRSPDPSLDTTGACAEREVEGTPFADGSDLGNGIDNERSAAGAGSEPPNGAGDKPPDMHIVMLARDFCYAAARGDTDDWAGFCRSLWVRPDLKQGCWARVYANEADRIGWCNWNF